MSCDASGSFAALYMSDALAAEIALTAVAPEQVPDIEGAAHPQTGAVVLGQLDGREVGVWEMTPGAMTDVEVDELCVIIAGRGTLERTVDGEGTTQQLRQGVVLQLKNGEETLWRVSEKLRKVYLA